VTISLAGDASSVAAVDGVLREHLAGKDLRVRIETVGAVDPAVVVTPSAASDDDLARVWIDLRSDERSTLYLVDGAWERVLVRHFARQDNPEVTREEIGHVVELALVALQAGERIGVGREDARAELAAGAAPPAAPTPATATAPVAAVATPSATSRPSPSSPPSRDAAASRAPRAAATRVRAGVFYEAQAYGGGAELWTGPGASFAIRHRPAGSRVGFGGSLSAQYRLPSDAETSSTPILRFEGAATHVLATGSYALSRSAELAVALGPGLELTHAEARGDRASDVTFGDGATRLSPVLRSVVRYEHAFPDLRFTVGLGADVPLDRARYLLARSGPPLVLFEGWPLRPFLALGVETP
jgi:hypothetical protein